MCDRWVVTSGLLSPEAQRVGEEANTKENAMAETDTATSLDTNLMQADIHHTERPLLSHRASTEGCRGTHRHGLDKVLSISAQDITHNGVRGSIKLGVPL